MGKSLVRTLRYPPTPVVDAVTAKFEWARRAEWSELSGGRTNFAWKLGSEPTGDVIVVKLYCGPALNPLFANDPKSEALLLQQLEPTGIAPRLLAYFGTTAGACVVYTHIPGDTWQNDASVVGKLIRSLHGIAPPKELRCSPDGSDALADKTESILAKCAENIQLLALRPVGSVPSLGRHVLLHGDIVPGNLILNETGLHLIDWQCPSVGDPCEDIAIFLSPAMQSLYRGRPLSNREVSEVFEAYQDHAIKARYRALAPWYHWRMAAYCQWQSENGGLDYAPARDLEIEALQRSRSP